MALSKTAIISIVVSVGLLVLIGLIIGILAIAGVFSSGSSSTDSGSSSTDSGSSSTDSGSSSTSTPPANGVRVTAISPEVDSNTKVYDNDDISIANGFQATPDGTFMDGKYFYFDDDEWDSNIGIRPMSGNTIEIQQWRDNGNRYENIWEGTINLGLGNGGRLDPWQSDQDATWKDTMENDANIWRIGDYIVKP